MTRLTNTQRIEILAEALKQAQADIKKLQREVRLWKMKYENKTVGGFGSYHSPSDLGYDKDAEI